MGLLDRLFGSRSAPSIAKEPPEPENITEWEVESFSDEGEDAEPDVQVVRLPLGELDVLDLSGVAPTKRTRIVGSFGWVTEEDRRIYGGSSYLLVREPHNQFDPQAVAVYGKGRKVGYLSSAKAAAFSQILDPLSFDAFKVGGASVSSDSIRMWVDLPTLPSLRAFVKGLPA